MTDQAQRDRLTREVQLAETAALTIRMDLEKLVADPAKVTSRRRDAAKIRAYRGELSLIVSPAFFNQEVERAFDAAVETFKARLDEIDGGLA